MKTSPTLNRIRPFAREDIPQVAELHRRAFGTANHSSPELRDAYHGYFTGVYLNNPWRDEAVESLIHREENGKITGFLGVVPKWMSMNGRPIRAAITTNFAVEPGSGGLVGMLLLKAALDGPQDLTIADESSLASRVLWERLGGVTSPLYSMRWLYPLRVCQFARFVCKEKKLVPPLLSAVSAPVARALDGLAARISTYPFRPPEPRLLGEDLPDDLLATCLSGANGRQSLRVDYNRHCLGWMLKRAGQLRRNGRLQKVLVKTQQQDIAGWYLYYLNPCGISEVVQIRAEARFAGDVIDHFLHHAWRGGAIALRGRMEPSLMQVFSERHFIFHYGPQWVLLHSRCPDMLRMFDHGDVHFSRLDGEWCFHFQ